jgi:phospholipid N-methyltransferase
MIFDILFSIRRWFERKILRRDYSVEPADIEEVEYSEEFADYLDRIFAETEEQIASGELKPMTIEEIAAMVGLKRSWWKGWIAVKS